MRNLIIVLLCLVVVGCEQTKETVRMPSINYEVCCDRFEYEEEQCFFCFSRESIEEWGGVLND